MNRLEFVKNTRNNKVMQQFARWLTAVWTRNFAPVELRSGDKSAEVIEGYLRHTPGLDGIRGWACASLLIAHCVTGVYKGSSDFFTTFSGTTLWLFLGGVDLFFVLSGFLIGGILLDSKGKSEVAPVA